MRSVLVASLVFFLAGCGSSVSEVSGSVQMNGKPLENVRLQFWNEADMSDGPAGVSEPTNEQGEFTVKATSSKLKAGSYIVVVQDMKSLESMRLAKGKMPMKAPPPEERPKPVPPRFDPDYSNRSKSTLKATLESGTNKLEPFQINANPNPKPEKTE